MSTQVPPEILDQTDQCWMDYTCLIEGKCLCEVWYNSVAMNVLFLRDTPPRNCPYSFPFARSYICRCPAYYYLYTQGIANVDERG